MATQTTNLQLVKPTYAEPTDIAVINGNMDILDGVVGGTSMGTTATTLTGAIAEHEGDISGINTELGKAEDSIAIVVNGDTAPQNISRGQYLFIKGHSSLASGGYHATAAISSGADVTSENVSADSDGIANSLYDSITNNDYTSTGLTPTNCSITVGGYHKLGKLVVINMRIEKTEATGVTITGFPRPSISSPYAVISVTGYDSSNEKVAFAYLSQYGALNFPTAYTETGNIVLNCTYMCQ